MPPNISVTEDSIFEASSTFIVGHESTTDGNGSLITTLATNSNSVESGYDNNKDGDNDSDENDENDNNNEGKYV